MKKIVALLLALLMVAVVFVGCGKTAEAPATDAPTAESESAAKNEEKVEEKKDDEPVTLTVYGTFVQYNDAFKAFVEAYEADHPNVKIDLTLESETYYDTLKTRISMNEIPDIFMTDGRNVTRPYLEYIEDISGTAIADKLYDATAEAATIDGILTGVPVESAPLGFVYNKGLFEQYGLTAPKTFSEFKNVCETLKASGITPVIMDCMDTWLIGDMICQGYAAAENPTQVAEDINSGKITLADVPEMQEMMAFYEYLLDNCQDKPISCDLTTSWAEFSAGEAGMIWSGPSTYATLIEFNPDLKLGQMGIPMSDKTEAKLPSEAYPVIHISKSSENKEEAMKFMEYLVNSEAGDAFVTASLGMPGWKTEATAGEGNPLFEDSVEYVEANLLTPYGFMLAPAGFEETSGEIVQEMILGNADAATTLANLNAKWMELLNK